MKNLAKYQNKITILIEELEEVVEELEEKRDAIEDRANEKDREMTDKEQERYYELDGQIEAIGEVKDNLDNALYIIDEYC